MSRDDALLTQLEIPLAFPVPVKGADGKEAERSKLTMRRPKTRHAKRLAVLVGKDVLDALINSEDKGEEQEQPETGGRELVVQILGRLLSAESLDGLTGLIADMCGEEPELIDELDILDLMAVGGAFLRFFPALQSAALTALPGTSRSSPAGSRTN